MTTPGASKLNMSLDEIIKKNKTEKKASGDGKPKARRGVAGKFKRSGKVTASKVGGAKKRAGTARRPGAAAAAAGGGGNRKVKTLVQSLVNKALRTLSTGKNAAAGSGRAARRRSAGTKNAPQQQQQQGRPSRGRVRSPTVWSSSSSSPSTAATMMMMAVAG